MERFVFTFRAGHPLCHCYQTVHAPNKSKAIKKMKETYGNCFDFILSQDDFFTRENQLARAGVPYRKELSHIYCREEAS
ncbi:hypothetical protein [Tissierella sp.]|uniref:hypothetical protein n=1 Tax=Tissierella sp. TaxID=41274 RepID=UPI0028657CF9|nr:hypothetical protein [Tissierella sp.]MDR7856020.1 hypothetical protein [Tissierella sp.]